MDKATCLKALEEISNLEKNWNGYGADPLSEKLITRSRSLLDMLQTYPLILPTACDLINFEFSANGVYIEVEVTEENYRFFIKFNDNRMKMGTYDESVVADCWNILTDMASKINNEDCIIYHKEEVIKK